MRAGKRGTPAGVQTSRACGSGIASLRPIRRYHDQRSDAAVILVAVSLYLPPVALKALLLGGIAADAQVVLCWLTSSAARRHCDLVRAHRLHYEVGLDLKAIGDGFGKKLEMRLPDPQSSDFGEGLA